MLASWAIVGSFLGLAALYLLHARVAVEGWDLSEWALKGLSVAGLVGASLYLATVLTIVGLGLFAWP